MAGKLWVTAWLLLSLDENELAARHEGMVWRSARNVAARRDRRAGGARQACVQRTPAGAAGHHSAIYWWVAVSAAPEDLQGLFI